DKFVQFKRVAEFLSRTETYRAAYFYYVEGLFERRQDGAHPVAVGTDGTFQLEAGRSYELELIQAQPQDSSLPSARIQVVPDGKDVQTIGNGEFSIASEFDRGIVPILAADVDGSTARHTVLAVQPQQGIQAPELQLGIVVRPATKRNVGIALGTTA